MVVPRPSMFRTALWAQTKRTCGVRVRSRVGQQLGRRTYASGGDHGHSSGGSDIPWMIGSVGVTVPAAWYLWQSGPDVSHGTGHGEVHHHDPPEEEKEGGEEDSKEGGEESKSGDSSSEGGDDTPKDTPEPSDDEGGDKEGDAEPGPESVKGKAKVEGPGVTRANHPTDPHDSDEGSQKAEGVAETAKVAGTVDTSKRNPP